MCYPSLTELSLPAHCSLQNNHPCNHSAEKMLLWWMMSRCDLSPVTVAKNFCGKGAWWIIIKKIIQVKDSVVKKVVTFFKYTTIWQARAHLQGVMLKPRLAGTVQSKGQAGLLVNAEPLFSELLQRVQETESTICYQMCGGNLTVQQCNTLVFPAAWD